MFARATLRNTAFAALLAVLFAVLLPSLAVANSSANPALAHICSSDGVKHAPASPDVAAHKPCVFCASTVPLFADAHAPRLVALADGVPLALGPLSPLELPPDPAATRPVSPRAPPAAR